MKRPGIIAALLLCLVSVPTLAGEPAFPTGKYSAVMETEASVDLTLGMSGNATLEIGAWEAGRREDATITRYKGHWSGRGRDVTATFPEGAVQMRFDSSLDFGKLGKKGAAPGFTITESAIEPALLLKRPLWLRSQLHAPQ